MSKGNDVFSQFLKNSFENFLKTYFYAINIISKLQVTTKSTFFTLFLLYSLFI